MGIKEKMIKSLATRELNLDIRRMKVNAKAAEVRKQLKQLNLQKEISEEIKKKFADAKASGIEALPNVKKGNVIYFGIGDDQYRGNERERKRLRATFSKMKAIAKQRGAKHIVIIHLGDNVEGSNRISSHKNLTQLVVGQAMQYTNVIMNELISMAKEFKVNFYMTVVDNHGELRMAGGPGEQPDNNILGMIATALIRESQYIPNLKVIAKDVFYGETLPGGWRWAGGHGNVHLLKKGAGLNKFIQMKDPLALVILAHGHHYEVIQEVTYDLIMLPAIKNHVEPYEIYGAWAVHDPKKQTNVRRGQFVEMEFEKGIVGETRLAMSRLHTV